jgi:hypothetical protein
MHHFASFRMKTSIMILGLACGLSAATAPVRTAAPAAAESPAPASAAGKSRVVLNQKEIHAAYNEGDFDKVTASIDGFNKSNKAYSRADSIFIAKHLAVVYSANPQTREKGKYFMYRLLEMMPSAELVDMFVSDEIDRIFEKVRREFLARQKSFGVDSSQISMPEKPSKAPASASKPAVAQPGPSSEFLAATREEKRPYWKRNGFWIAGGVGLVVAGTAAVYIYSQQEEPSGKTIVIPSQAASQN